MYNSVKDFFSYLNSREINYIVLRNYEEFEHDDFLISGHADIDVLCSDRKSFREIIGVGEGQVHCRITIANQNVPLDIRETGDGYYCTEWEEDMLMKRKMYNALCYVMDDETYFYSLIYHVLIHKHSIAPEYPERLKNMGIRLGINDTSESKLIGILEDYMSAHGYYYVYPDDLGVALNFDNVNINRKMLRKSYSIIAMRKFMSLKSFAKRIIKTVIRKS
ncbi:MAG: hypothetical protein IJS42_05645 [Synergistaceae bacterium]|nr:hypothetical protein [Synergistaceae bacterium]